MPHDGWHPPGEDHREEHPPHHRHGPPTRRAVLAATTLLPFGIATAQTADAAQRIADAANRFLGQLDDGQRQRVLIAFDSDNRLDWHYIPRSRPGLGLGEMRPPQVDTARALLASVLNERGLQLVDGVRLLEGVLRESQGSFRDPGRYYVSVFGRPGTFPWGWRFEGHHLSLNVALPVAGHVAVTPFFAGAHPATVRDGPNRGFRLLGTSEDLARQIMAGLGEMTGPQRSLVEALIDRFLGTLAADLAATQKRRVMEQGLGAFRFAWAGSLAPGEAHYFRLHGPATVIEHDNTQNGANHIHAVWRDLAADFGRDALAEHYRTRPHR